MFDLAPREFVPASLHDKTIEISVQDFCTILEIGDNVQARVDERRDEIEAV